MRMLLIHTDRFAFQVTGETAVSKAAKDLTETDRGGESGEALVAFMASEEGDERGLDAVAGKAAAAILEQAEKVGAPAVWVYPYAHLSSNLSSPRVAQKLLDGVEARVRKDAGDRAIHRAPFGYYKSFEIECKGHPLSELARTITAADGDAEAGDENQALEKEKQLVSEWRVYGVGADPVPPEEAAWKDLGGLKDLFEYESAGSRQVDEPPPHIRLMQDLELVDYEPGSDSGNLRWYPNGYLMKRLLEDRANELMAEAGAMQIETPIMYDYDHPHLNKYLNRFPARQYILRSDKREFFLRFAACFGGYLMMHDGSLSYRHLPAKYYEMTHFSFRREQSGELAGLRRLRAFTMPDMHTLVAGEDEAVTEFLEHVRLCRRWLDDIGLETQVAIRFVRSFLDAHPDLPAKVTEIMGQPALVEVWDQRFFYFVAKFECNFVDSSGKAACLGTTQIDVENSECFEIEYTGADGNKHRPLIMHTSIPGAIERNIYGLLETQAMGMKKGKKAAFPFWLAPTQVRFIPVKPDHIEAATAWMKASGFRADIDDRAGESLGKRIRAAEKSWVPLIAVVGDKEIEGGTLSVRVRGEKAQKTMTPAELEALMSERQGGRPTRPMNVPRELSRRPIFVGGTR